MLLVKPVPLFLSLPFSLIYFSQFIKIDIVTTASGSVGVYLVLGGKQMMLIPILPRQLIACAPMAGREVGGWACSVDGRKGHQDLRISSRRRRNSLS